MNTIIANFQCAQPSHKESVLVTQNILFCTLHQLLQASLLSCQPHQSKRTTTGGFCMKARSGQNCMINFSLLMN